MHSSTTSKISLPCTNLLIYAQSSHHIPSHHTYHIIKHTRTTSNPNNTTQPNTTMHPPLYPHLCRFLIRRQTSTPCHELLNHLLLHTPPALRSTCTYNPHPHYISTRHQEESTTTRIIQIHEY